MFPLGGEMGHMMDVRCVAVCLHLHDLKLQCPCQCEQCHENVSARQHFRGGKMAAW